MTDHGTMEITATERQDNGLLYVTCVCHLCGRVVSFGIDGGFRVIEHGDFEARHQSGIGAPGLGLDLGEPELDDVWGEFLAGLDWENDDAHN